MTVPAWQLNCPVKFDESSERITLAHGEGARLTRRLIDELICPRFRSLQRGALPDAAHIDTTRRRMAVSVCIHLSYQ